MLRLDNEEIVEIRSVFLNAQVTHLVLVMECVVEVLLIFARAKGDGLEGAAICVRIIFICLIAI